MYDDDFGDAPDPDGPLGETLEALSDHLILEDAATSEDRTPSGLLIPANAATPKGGYRRFRVLAVGPLCGDDRLSEFPEATVEIGDIVLAPTDELGLYREGGQTYYIAHYDVVAAVIREG